MSGRAQHALEVRLGRVVVLEKQDFHAVSFFARIGCICKLAKNNVSIILGKGSVVYVRVIEQSRS
jgi:hypothetical protein